MAERRMMSKKVIHSDDFMDLPATTKNLYFYLMIEADDDGFVNSPKRIQRMVGATDDDAKLLLAKKFLISFESGVIVIKHWKMHNYIRSDRYKATTHTKEADKLHLRDNGVYTLDTVGIPVGDVGKDRLGKDRLGKDRLVEESTREATIETITETEVSASNVAEYLLSRILSKKPNFKKPNMSTWIKDIDKAMRIDKRTEKELIGCINWIYSDGNFWIPNILSGKKLRDKFDTMEAQMLRDQNKGQIDFSWMDELEAEDAS